MRPGAAVLAIREFARCSRESMRQFMPANSCIGSAKTTIEVMKLLGLKAFEIPVSMVFQVPARSYARVSGLTDEEKAEARAQAKSWRDDIPDDQSWNGHLIVLVEDRWMVDPSVDQLGDKELGVEVPPDILVLDTKDHKFDPAGFDMQIKLTMENGDKATLFYRTTGDSSYQQTGAWTDEGIPFLAQAILFRMAVMAMVDGAREELAKEVLAEGLEDEEEEHEPKTN
jgi:hypothetical protein